jgi:hypothetical protein
MPAAVAFPIIGAEIGAIAGLGGAKKQAKATQHAADLQSQAAAQALRFQQEQAARDQANFETTQHANYDQWAARENRLSTFGQMVGLPSRQIPAYQGTTPSGATGPGGAEAQGYFQSLTTGKAPTPQSLLSLEPQLNQRGIKVLRNAAGTAGKIQLPSGQIVDVIQSAGTGGTAWQWLTGGGSAPAARVAPRSGYQVPMSTMLTPSTNLVPTPQLSYQPLTTLSDLVR